MTGVRAKVRKHRPATHSNKHKPSSRGTRRDSQKQGSQKRQESAHLESHAANASQRSEDHGERLHPATRLATLQLDADGVCSLPLPHRPLLEDRFGRPLHDVEVLAGPDVARALDGLHAQAAELDGRVFLPSANASVDVVAHEVAHALQRRGAPVAGPESFLGSLAEQPGIVTSGSAAEQDAQHRALHGGAPSASLPTGAVALLQQGQSPGTQTAGTQTDSQSDSQSDPNQDASGTSADPSAKDSSVDSDSQKGSSEDPGAGGEPEIEQSKPSFEVPPMPETQLSPEEQAKRDEELAAANEKFKEADTGGAVVEVFADTMPPSLKAQNQGALSGRVGEVVDQSQKDFEGEIPDIEAKMGGEPDAESVPKIEAPAIGDVKLEDGTPAKTEKPDLPPTADPGKFQGNSEVKSLMAKLFSLFGFGKDSINKSFKEVKTGDDIETSPGPAPKVPVEKGTETDPERIENQKKNSKDESEKAGLGAQQAVIDGPGPEQVKLRDVTETRTVSELKQPETPELNAAEGADTFNQIAAREDASLAAQFDVDQQESMQQSLQEAKQETQLAETDRDTQRKAELERVETERKTLEEASDVEHRAKVHEAHETIQTERQKTLDSQADEVKSIETQSEKARGDEKAKIETRVREDEGKIETKYTEKEDEAKGKVEKGEEDADKEKKAAEKESDESSWWDKAVNWVEKQFAKLTAAIGEIFDAVRTLVKEALDAARKFAKDLIDAAASFIKSAIEVFGELVKGLVNVLVGTFFPDLAKKLNEAIDGAVDLAKKGVDVVAEGLKKGVDAIVDGLQKGLDAILDAFQAALNFAISLVQAALTGDWGAVFKQLLEAALKLLGIDPKEFYAFAAKVQETLGLIVDKPGQFLSNVLGAVKLGFSFFADNFLQHLKSGILGWLTGSLGGSITFPKTFDLIGILDLVRQLLGLTWDWLKERAAKIIGEKNVERLEHLFSYVETLRTEGWGGLFNRLKEDLVGLKDQVLGKIGEFLTVQVIKAAVIWLASLFNPVGALVKVLMTVWNIYTFLRDQLSRIMQVVKTVVGALDKIARGVLEEAGKKVESVLGLLVPVAIDLLAKLLGLTGVTAKVREILKNVNQSITKVVDKVLKKVAAKFKGKGKNKGKDAKKDKAQKDKDKKGQIRLGKPMPVKVPKGKGHTLSIEPKGQDAVVTLRSEEKPVITWLNSFQAKVDSITDKESQKKAKARLTKGTELVQKLDTDADKLLAAALTQTPTGKKKKAPKAAVTPEEIDKVERNLRDVLTDLFAIFGHPTHEEEIKKARPDVKKDLLKAISDPKNKLSESEWSQIVTFLKSGIDPFAHPLLKQYEFGKGIQKSVKTKLAARKDEDIVPDSDADIDAFLKSYLVKRVNNEGGSYQTARVELQDAMFSGAGTWPALDVALEDALKAANKGEGVDEELKKEAGGSKFTGFLLAMGKDQNFGTLQAASWEKVYWGKAANQNWIKSKFRGSGGLHEWVPTSYISQVVERARKANASEGAEAAGMWMRFHDTFRTETKFLFYKPEGGTVQEVGYTRNPLKTSQKVGGPAKVIQGHTGAVYAPIKQGDYDDKNRVVPQVKGQGPWHDGLRKIFNDQASAAVTTQGVKNVISGMDQYAKDTLWAGDSAPGGNFQEYYTKQKSEADGADLVSPATLGQRAGQAAKEVKGDIDRTKKALGL